MSKHKIPIALRLIVETRARRCCEYCKYPLDFSHAAFHIDHIIPTSKGGSIDLKNLALACDKCNNLKWIWTFWKDPKTGKLTPLFHPRKDKWHEHFAWSDDFSMVNGITSKGRATIELLQINRPGLVNVRKALHKIGAHPPQ